MKQSIALVAHAAVTGAVGLCLLMAAATLDNIGWALVELPRADNSIVPGLVLAMSGIGFVIVALGAGIAGVALRRRERRVVVGVAVASLLGTFLAGVVAVHGATVVAARAVASVLRPVIEESWLLEPPTYDGQVLVTAALATVVLAGLVLLVPGPGPRSGESRAVSGASRAGSRAGAPEIGDNDQVPHQGR